MACEDSLYIHKTCEVQERAWNTVEAHVLSFDAKLYFPCVLFVVLQEKQDFPVRLIRPTLDFKILADWLRFCETKHLTECATGWLSSTRLLPQGFRVIDCETRNIVSGISKRFAALSYVWGGWSESQPRSEYVSHYQPATIEDAITLTRNLKIRYLWIDRYCIDQSNHNDVHEQVSKMHVIYSEAYVTIVAAAGTDPTFGLSGVGKRTRSSQPHAKVGDHLLISSLGTVSSEIEGSTWNSRGWTYQEAILSRRRLIFTETQVYFECMSMSCCEALNLPLEKLHTSNLRDVPGRYDRMYKTFLNPEYLPRYDAAMGLTIIQNVLGEYVKKSLSKAGDILNGISGILGALEDTYGLRYCHGVPIFGSTSNFSNWSSLIGFLSGLCWYHNNGFLKSMTVSRCQNFPTWSWAGWMSPGDTDHLLEFSQLSIPRSEWPPRISIRVELRQGQVMSWEEFDQGYAKVKMQLSPVLQVTAPLYRLHAMPWWIENIDNKCASLGNNLMFIYHASSQDSILLARCYGFHLVTEVNEACGTYFKIMVISEVEEGMYERIGFALVWEDQHYINRDTETIMTTFKLR